MEVMIGDAVRDYMKKKETQDLTLSVHKSGGGCCPTFEVAEVTLGKPEKADWFRTVDESGIHVHIAKNVKAASPVIRFKLQKNLFTKTVIAEGLKLLERDR
jgi:hypothetical protein